ncbi:hypothetical protein LSO9J_90037 [Candidatus Liberibacter solanacearum]
MKFINHGGYLVIHNRIEYKLFLLQFKSNSTYFIVYILYFIYDFLLQYVVIQSVT